jgi:hypothetical protein
MAPAPSIARIVGRVVFVIGALAAAASAWAQLPDPYQGRNEWNPTDAEVVNLPPYCQADMRPQVFRAPGTRAYGCSERFNHFCPAIVAMNRAMNPTLPMTARRYNLQLAEGHLNYTRTHMPATCRLAPDLQAAENQTRLLRTLVK